MRDFITNCDKEIVEFEKMPTRQTRALGVKESNSD